MGKQNFFFKVTYFLKLKDSHILIIRSLQLSDNRKSYGGGGGGGGGGQPPHFEGLAPPTSNDPYHQYAI